MNVINNVIKDFKSIFSKNAIILLLYFPAFACAYLGITTMCRSVE